MARPPLAPPGLPPAGGLPIRTRGGRVTHRARGGKITSGPAFEEGMRARPVDHAPGKMDTKDVGRGPVITRKRGGAIKAGLGAHHLPKGHYGKMAGGIDPPKNPVRGGGDEAPHHPKEKEPIGSEKGPMGPDYNVGSGGGGARLRKRERAPKFVHRVP